MKVPIVDLKNVVPKKTIESVEEVIKSGYWVDGPQVKKLEADFANFCGVQYCRALCNGTAALMTLMASLDLASGDEVIVPSFTFIATANSVNFTDAKPVFADVSEDTFTIDPESIKNKITPHTKAIMPVHLFGLCANMKAIKEICEDHDIKLIEDAAQAHGAKINDKRSGSFGYGAGFSLYPTKNMFAGGEGGLITTNDEELFKKVNLIMNHGQSKKYYHTRLGYNFRLAEINGVLARYSLNKIEEWNEKRRENAEYLTKKLDNVDQIELPTIPNGYRHVYHQYTIKVKASLRQKVINALEHNDIGYGIHYAIPIHQQPYYKDLGYDKINLPITERLAEEVLSLPIHPLLEKIQLDFVAKTIKNCF